MDIDCIYWLKDKDSAKFRTLQAAVYINVGTVKQYKGKSMCVECTAFPRDTCYHVTLKYDFILLEVPWPSFKKKKKKGIFPALKCEPGPGIS